MRGYYYISCAVKSDTVLALGKEKNSDYSDCQLQTTAYAVCGRPVVKNHFDGTIQEGLWDSKNKVNISKNRATPNDGNTSQIMASAPIDLFDEN